METKRLVAGFAAVVGLVGAVGAGSAIAQDSPKSAHGIPNLTDVKQEITVYHDSGNWDRELAKADGAGQSYLEGRLRHGVDKPAIVLDIDDTALETYSYEVQHDFGYDPTQWNDYAYAKKFGAVTSTLALVKYATANKVSVFFVTGRRESDQMRTATLGNLTEVGYPAPTTLYLRPVTDKDPSAVPYKSGVRADLQKQGYDVLLNVGDQYSDLQGGHADRTVKLANPMYSIP